MYNVIHNDDAISKDLAAFLSGRHVNHTNLVFMVGGCVQYLVGKGYLFVNGRLLIDGVARKTLLLQGFVERRSSSTDGVDVD